MSEALFLLQILIFVLIHFDEIQVKEFFTKASQSDLRDDWLTLMFSQRRRDQYHF
jgi:hypothetical protein